MELKEFVRSTLVDIVDGIKAAQEDVSAKGAVVAPRSSMVSFSDKTVSEAVGKAKDVHFDIALSEESGKGTKGGIGVFLSAVSLGAQGESTNAKGSLSRISFDVPVVFPGM